MNGGCARGAGLLELYNCFVLIRRSHILNLYPTLYPLWLAQNPHISCYYFNSIPAGFHASSLSPSKSSKSFATRVNFLKQSSCITLLLKNPHGWGSNSFPWYGYTFTISCQSSFQSLHNKPDYSFLPHVPFHLFTFAHAFCLSWQVVLSSKHRLIIQTPAQLYLPPCNFLWYYAFHSPTPTTVVWFLGS